MKNKINKNRLFILLSIFSAVCIVFSPIIVKPASTYATNSGLFPGDLNGDGAVDVLDLILLKLILLGELEPMKAPFLDENSDVDQNGIINFIDNGALLDLIFGVIHSQGGGGGGGGGGGSFSSIPTVTPTPTAIPPVYYQDADGDGYGNPNVSLGSGTQLSGYTTNGPSGYVLDNTDCDDSNPAINPGATEVCDGVDNNCNGQIDEGFPDTDSDGKANCVDPDDDGDGVADEQDCSPLDGSKWQLLTGYVDADGDGYGISTGQGVCSGATLPTGYASVGGDCNDSSTAINPGAAEVCDGIDNNCNGQIDEGFTDTDSDGKANCTDPDDDGDGVVDESDCSPLDGTKWQMLTGYTDVDGDGYGTGTGQGICSGASLPGGYASVGGDCNDSSTAINPGATEVCDGIDNNCNGQIDEGFTDTDSDGKANCTDPDDDGDGVVDESDCSPLDGTKWQVLTGYTDADGDGYGTGSSQSVCSGASLPGGYSSVGGDCNDSNAAVHPGAAEIVNGIDDNCDGKVDIVDGSLHHLGDDHYSGSINSQFQMATEGTTYSRSFTAGSLQLYTKATLSITHRGVQKADPIKINGQLISSGWDSPSDGSLGTTTISFDISILKAGANTVTITSSYDSYNHDYDDFEFTNIYITLSN